MAVGRSKRRPECRRLHLVRVALAALIATVGTLAAPAAWAQTADDVELTVHLDAAASRDEAPSGDVTIEFSDASTREPVVSYVVEASTEEQGFVVAVPLLESRSGWFVRARSPGWWGPTAYVDPDARDVELTLVPEGVVRFVVDGTDTGVDLLRTGQVWIAGRVGNRGVRLDRGVYGGPCEVDREPDRRDVLIFCPFARDETVDLRVRLGPFLPLLESDVTIAADLDLGFVEPVRGAVVTGSLPSGDGSSRRFGLLQPDTWSFAWSAWTDSGGFFAFEGLSPGAYELRLAGSDGDGGPVRIEALTDQIDLGQLVSAAGNVLAVSFLVPSGVDLDDIRPEVWEATLGPDGAVEDRGRRFEFEERGRDGSFLWRGLPTGDYEVGVEDNRGNRWHHEVILDVVVRAEGLGMNGWRFDVRDGVPVEVDLLADRGSLRVPRGQDGLHFRGARLYTPGGASILIGALAAINDRGQIQEDSDEAIVNDLAPGTYSYCPKDNACTRIDILPWAEARIRD